MYIDVYMYAFENSLRDKNPCKVTASGTCPARVCMCVCACVFVCVCTCVVVCVCLCVCVCVCVCVDGCAHLCVQQMCVWQVTMQVRSACSRACELHLCTVADWAWQELSLASNCGKAL